MGTKNKQTPYRFTENALRPNRSFPVRIPVLQSLSSLTCVLTRRIKQNRNGSMNWGEERIFVVRRNPASVELIRSDAAPDERLNPATKPRLARQEACAHRQPRN